MKKMIGIKFIRTVRCIGLKLSLLWPYYIRKILRVKVGKY